MKWSVNHAGCDYGYASGRNGVEHNISPTLQITTDMQLTDGEIREI